MAALARATYSIPQGHVGIAATDVAVAGNCAPLVGGAVHAHSASQCVALVDHLLDEFAVGGFVRAPATAGGRVRLDVKPVRRVQSVVHCNAWVVRATYHMVPNLAPALSRPLMAPFTWLAALLPAQGKRYASTYWIPAACALRMVTGPLESNLHENGRNAEIQDRWTSATTPNHAEHSPAIAVPAADNQEIQCALILHALERRGGEASSHVHTVTAQIKSPWCSCAVHFASTTEATG